MSNFTIFFYCIHFVLKRSVVLGFILVSSFSYAVTYTMGTSGSLSATVTATSGSPDTFIDDGLGGGGKYSNNVDATYTFNCAGGKYVRFKINSMVTEASFDKFYVYDGATTSDRLMGETYFSGADPGDYMYVSTTGSITVRFVTDGSTVKAGWDISVWIDNYPGQLWDGSSSTQPTTAANWEGDVIPYGGFTSIYIPSGLSNYPDLSNASSGSIKVFDMRLISGASFTYSTTTSGRSLFIYGSFYGNGTFTHTGSYYIQCEGGTSSNYALISGTGTLSTIHLDFGYNRNAFYKLDNSLTCSSINVENEYGNSIFDMNNYNLTTYYFDVESSTTFYQRTGILEIEESSSAINDASFNEGTGTTYFSSGTAWGAGNQTIPSITYYNLKVRTNNTYTATIGSGTALTVSNDFTILNPGTGGGVATLANDITVGNNFYLGNTGNALTLNAPYRIYRSSGTGTLSMGNVTSHAVNVTYASASNYVFSGFGATNTFYGTVTYNSASAQKVIPGTYYHLTTNGAGTKTLYGNMDINGNITLSGGTLSQGSYTMNIAGNWSSTGNYYAEGTGIVTFDGTGQNTITGTTASLGETGHVILSEDFEDGGSAPAGWTQEYVAGATSFTFRAGAEGGGSITTANGGSGYNASMYYGGYADKRTKLVSPEMNFTGYTSNATVSFYYGNEAWSSDQDILKVYYKTSSGGSWTLIQTYSTNVSSWTNVVSLALPNVNSTYYIAFEGDANYGRGVVIDDISVTGDSGSSFTGEAFNKFAINKTSGGNITLGSSILVQTDLTFTAGVITTTNDYQVELHEDATMTNTPTNTCHINGYIKKNKNTTAKFTFPCGDGSYYRPLAITPAGTGATIWTCKYFTNGHADQSVLDIDHISEVEYWTLDRAGASPENATIELSWNENSFVDEDYLDLVVAHYNGTDWHDAGNNNIIGDSSAGTLESDVNWSDYSPFTLGSIIGNVPLPITLVDFDANPYLNNVKTSWTTSSEINNDFFTVERSPNGVDFTPVGRVEGAGNSDYEINYTLIDKNFDSGINYYRLKQTDFDGKETFSPIVSVDIEKDVRVLLITVNSLGQEVNSNYKGIVFDIYSDGSSTKRIQ
jgi:hypothetical protein